MTLREFVYQVQKYSGNPSGEELSMDLILTYITEEMRYCCGIFPQKVSFTETLTDNAVADSRMELIRPTAVWVDASRAQKVTAGEMHQLIGTANTGSRYFWAQISGIVNIAPGSGTARVIGDLRTPTYTQDDLDYEITNDATVATGKIAGLTGIPFPVVRYRVLQRAAEELGHWDKAQYFLSLARTREIEARRVYESETNEDVGFVQGGEWL